MQAQNKVYMWARSHGSPVEEEKFHKNKKKRDDVPGPGWSGPGPSWSDF